MTDTLPATGLRHAQARLKEPPQNPAHEPLALRPRDAAAALGISPRLLWTLTARGDGPPVVRIGRAVRYPTDGLRQWLRDESQRGAA